MHELTFSRYFYRSSVLVTCTYMYIGKMLEKLSLCTSDIFDFFLNAECDGIKRAVVIQ